MGLGDTYQENNITSPLETFEWDNFRREHTEVCTNGVHQTEEGNMLLAEKVVKTIKTYVK